MSGASKTISIFVIMKNTFLVFLLLVCWGMNAQTNARSIEGFVKDDKGSPVKGIKVLLDNAVQIVDSTLTGNDGFYVFNKPLPGIYYVVTADSRYKESKVNIQAKAGYVTEISLVVYPIHIGQISDPPRKKRKESHNDARGAIYTGDDIRKMAVPR